MNYFKLNFCQLFTFTSPCGIIFLREKSMKEQLENIYNSAKSDIENAKTISDIDEIRLKYLSRKGEFNAIKKGLKDLSDEDKRVVGAFANKITQDLESMLKEKHDLFYQKDRSFNLSMCLIIHPSVYGYLPWTSDRPYSSFSSFFHTN